MDTCRVIRCTVEASETFGIDVPDRVRRELPICAAHRQAIRDGARWQYDTDDDAIVMGEDLDVAVAKVVTGFSVRLFGDTQLDDGTGHEMLLELKLTLDPGMGIYGLPKEQMTVLVPVIGAKAMVDLLGVKIREAEAMPPL